MALIEKKFEKDGLVRTVLTPGDAIRLHNDGWNEVEEIVEADEVAPPAASEVGAKTPDALGDKKSDAKGDEA